jgi:hypothetical protein
MVGQVADGADGGTVLRALPGAWAVARFISSIRRIV